MLPESLQKVRKFKQVTHQQAPRSENSVLVPLESNGEDCSFLPSRRHQGWIVTDKSLQ